jgi:hypothetical protein
MRIIKPHFVVAGGRILSKRGSLIYWNRAVRRALFAFFVLPFFVLSGCDALSEFLGSDSTSKKPENKPKEDPKPGQGQDPVQGLPPSSVPANVTVSGGVKTIIPLTEEEEENLAKWNEHYAYEVHIFVTSGDLTFSSDPAVDSVVADYLIVAGGGGAGNSSVNEGSGGGGAGGVLYKTAETLTLTDGAVKITVGDGGSGNGVDGRSSFVGAIEVPGGGGGTPGAEGTMMQDPVSGSGKNGGSGGGGGSKKGAAYDVGGYGKRRTGTTGQGTDDPPVDDAVMGNDGGDGFSISDGNGTGGGGGGADGPGFKGEDGGYGGESWIPEGDTAWIQTATGTSEFSHGGSGGLNQTGTFMAGQAGVNYGDGGSGGVGSNATGGKGHGGVVVIRFLRILEDTE